MATPFVEALQRVASALQREEIPFVIVGGLATAIWGEARVTRDVDCKVFIGPRSPDDFEALIAREFELTPRLPGVPLLVVTARLGEVPVDFLIAVPGYEDEVLRRAHHVALGALTLPFCSAEDLIVQKIISDRNKDWADIESVLLEQRADLDQEHIRHWLAQFAEVLEREDWIARYEELWSRIVADAP